MIDIPEVKISYDSYKLSPSTEKGKKNDNILIDLNNEYNDNNDTKFREDSSSSNNSKNLTNKISNSTTINTLNIIDIDNLNQEIYEIHNSNSKISEESLKYNKRKTKDFNFSTKTKKIKSYSRKVSLNIW